jgi:hypothetical protein
MRYGLCVAAATAALFAMPAVAGPLSTDPLSTDMSSQGVTIEGPGVGVHVGPRHDRWRHERHWRDREVRGHCKTVTVRERGPNGSMISKTRSNC